MNSKYNKLVNEALDNTTSRPLKVDEIFEEYEDIGMSAEMGLNDLISATMQDIVRQVPENSRVSARIAVKKMWLEKIKDWKTFEGYE